MTEKRLLTKAEADDLIEIEHEPIRRPRASERSLTVTLKAMKAAGLTVDKVLVSGGQIEISCAGVAGKRRLKNDGGLEDW